MTEETVYPLTWDLDVLLPHPESEEFSRELQRFQSDVRQLADESDQLPPVDGKREHVDSWIDFLKRYEEVEGRATDLHAFIGCHAAADANNKHFQQLEGRLSALDPFRQRISTNVEFAFKEASPADFEALIQADPSLEEVEFFLRDRRRHAELRLPREQELLLADLSVDGIHAWGRFYDRISGELRVSIMDRGEIVQKSPGQIHFDSPERSVRQNNFYASNKAWNQIADHCADALNHLSGTRLTVYRRVGLQDHLEAPLRYNRMQRATLEAMWSTISERKSVLLKYLDCKAALLGLKKLCWYDLLAPLPAGRGKTRSEELSYDEACRLIIGTFGRFSEDFGDFAQQAIEQRWIEAENRSGKRQGGFCTGFPTKKQSRIFMTFTNTPDSMSTIAHELGHAYHSHVLRERPLFLQEYPMNLAETASTFAEAVLGEERLRNSDSVDEQLNILDNMLGDSVAFLMNIHTRFIFEDNFHREREQGELSADRFSEIMLAAQKEAYLDGLDDDGWNPSFWISKLHFYISSLPFYNFPYTFGYLLSLGVYALATETGPDFPQQYRELLLATGSADTEEAVQSTLGYDLTQPAFWNKSLDIVEQRVERFLELADSDR